MFRRAGSRLLTHLTGLGLGPIRVCGLRLDASRRGALLGVDPGVLIVRARCAAVFAFLLSEGKTRP